MEDNILWQGKTRNGYDLVARKDFTNSYDSISVNLVMKDGSEMFLTSVEDSNRGLNIIAFQDELNSSVSVQLDNNSET